MITREENHLNYKIIEFDVVDSTMITVRNYPFNTVVNALKQTSGRGKGSRVWDSKNVNNLYTSMKIKKENNLDNSQLTFIISIAIREAIRNFDKNNNSIVSKWPNDVLINDKKTSGILLQLIDDSIIIGFGINIDYYPSEALFKATSLKENNIIVDKYNLLKEILNRFNVLFNQWKLNGFEPIRQKWLKNCYKLNEEIEANGIKGTFIDLDKDGTLVMKLEDNSKHYIKSADIF